MTEATFTTRLNQLIKDVSEHPYREELLRLVEEQLLDDDNQVVQTN